MNAEQIEKRTFLFDQYENEENYLSNKHKEGWKLVKIKRRLFNCKYYFEKCASCDVAYQLDYFEKAEDDSDEILNEKIQFYTDAGWELVVENINHWYYFRKNIKDAGPLLYSDPTSKIDMAKKASNRVAIILTMALMVLAHHLSFNVDEFQIDGLHSLVEVTNFLTVIIYELLLCMILYFMGRVLAFEKKFYQINDGDFQKSNLEMKRKIPLFWGVLSMLVLLFSILAYTNGSIGDFCRAAFVWIALGIALAFWAVVFGTYKQSNNI